MYEKQVLGDHTGFSLLNSMWLICTTYFGMRTGKETHSLKWGDIRLGLDEQIGIASGMQRQIWTSFWKRPFYHDKGQMKSLQFKALIRLLL